MVQISRVARTPRRDALIIGEVIFASLTLRRRLRRWRPKIGHQPEIRHFAPGIPRGISLLSYFVLEKKMKLNEMI